MNQFPHSDQETEPKTILVIDDIPSLRSIYQAYLADAGYRPIAAKSAAIAAKAASALARRRLPVFS